MNDNVPDHCCYLQLGRRITACGKPAELTRYVNVWQPVTCPDCLWANQVKVNTLVALLDRSVWMISHNTRTSLDGNELGVVYAAPAENPQEAWQNAERVTGMSKAAMRARGWRAVRVSISSLPRSIAEEA